MVPLLGCLGIDRLYLGATVTGCIKLGVCLCTCFIGGVVWGIIDAVVIFLNAVEKEESIDSLGMSAQFADPQRVETAQTLAWVMLGVWLLFGTLGCCFRKSGYGAAIAALAVVSIV
mmetsp:Transcript_22482/g.41385  ORF Transcript_22482/g.41385 Transcript_22482/m.41385 type:complete len:116 (+) Transcript_22482:325-672(+)